MNHRRPKRRSKPPANCDVPGCGQAIRFVKVPRYDYKLQREALRWVAINTAPARPGDENASIATIYITEGILAADVRDEDHDMVMERAGELWVEHRATCIDPNWHKVQKAAAQTGRHGED